ncbi:MAG: hypothetical protein AB7O74_14760 [Candidatus Nanopelagicales bacterium]
MDDHTTAIENRARTWLREAVRSHDTVTVSALRSLIGAIGNAGAIPVDGRAAAASSEHVAGAAIGAGAAEAPRRVLSDDDVEGIVRAEIRERRTAMEVYGSSATSHRLAAEIVVLEGLLSHP